ncbi:MAG: hypothetical protein JRE57_00220 [Deltaproteobacteria bacterium]|nr:hypothetical protein [Deltaproteobacteria bacterium]
MTAADPAPIEKTAAAPKTSFEKVAARLDRDIVILKIAGACGTSFGMCKRANAYIDVLLTNCDLSPDEFGELFDKVAAEAISTDIEASLAQLGAECPDDLKPWLEAEFSKIGFELAADAELEKQAIIGLLSKGLMHTRAAGAAVGAGAKALARGAKSGLSQTRRGISGGMGHIKATMGASKARMAGRALGKVKAKGALGRAYKQSLIKTHQSGHAAQVAGLKKMERAGANLSGKQKKLLSKANRRATPKPPAAPATTAPPKTPAATVAATTEAKAIKSESGRTRAVDDAAKATKQPDNVVPIRKGTGTDGPAPQAAPKPAPSPTAAAETAQNAGAPKGIVDKIMSQGVNSLTTGEKVQAGLTAYIGGKVAFGD